MNPTTPAELREIAREAVPHWSDLDWLVPSHEFRVWDDGNPHGRLCIVFPGGQLVDIGCHADPLIDTRRANWVCNALNAARARDLGLIVPSSAPMTPELRAAIGDLEGFRAYLRESEAARAVADTILTTPEATREVPTQCPKCGISGDGCICHV